MGEPCLPREEVRENHTPQSSSHYPRTSRSGFCLSLPLTVRTYKFLIFGFVVFSANLNFPEISRSYNEIFWINSLNVQRNERKRKFQL